MDARLSGMDKATSLLNDGLNRVLQETEKQVMHLRNLHGEKFTEMDFRLQQRFDTLKVERADDRMYYDTKFQDLRDLKSHDLIGVEQRLQMSKDFVAKGFEAQNDLREADLRYLETKIIDLRDLKAHDLQAIEQRFQLSKAAVSDALEAAKEAVNKAESATEKRFASVNEFRSTLSDQAAQLMPRAEAQARFETILANVGRIELDLRGAIANTGGKSNAYVQFLGTGLAVVAILVALAAGVMHTSTPSPSPSSGMSAFDKRVDDLINRVDGLSRRIDNTENPRKLP
jgi:hypothetical protein